MYPFLNDLVVAVCRRVVEMGNAVSRAHPGNPYRSLTGN